jgi:HD superfamily phosphohydrolase
MDGLMKDQAHSDYKLTEADKRIVSIAGLCHDIGHGPFSHIFDGKFMPAIRPERNFTHEEMGATLIDYMVD